MRPLVSPKMLFSIISLGFTLYFENSAYLQRGYWNLGCSSSSTRKDSGPLTRTIWYSKFVTEIAVLTPDERAKIVYGCLLIQKVWVMILKVWVHVKSLNFWDMCIKMIIVGVL